MKKSWYDRAVRFEVWFALVFSLMSAIHYGEIVPVTPADLAPLNLW